MATSGPVEPEDEDVQAPVLAILCLGQDVNSWTATVTSLIAANVPVLALTAGPREPVARLFQELPIRVETWTLSEAGAHLAGGGWRAGFVVTAPVIVPRQPFERALAAIDGDARVCTVSFFSNDANYLSFPWRNSPSALVVNGHSEETITRRLRAESSEPDIVPIPVPAGGGVLFSTAALRALGGFDGLCETAEVAVLDVALRGIKRGFRNVLDAQTFIVRPLQANAGGDALNDEAARRWLNYRFHFFPTLFDYERDADDTPLADSIAIKRSYVVGLRVLMDGSCLGPYEMGTQVALLAQVDALVKHQGIDEVIVATPGGLVPPYAASVLMQRGVSVCPAGDLTFPDVGRVDILHRPFQSGDVVPVGRWRKVARRTVVTIHDLIAYDNGNYHASAAGWLSYRQGVRASVRDADAVVAISNDTAQSMRAARLPMTEMQLSVIENGTDYMTVGAADEQAPIELLESGRAAADFILVLGAAYSHKNRDLAIRAWHELRRRGHPTELVLAGVVVPLGSSRNEEAIAASQGEWPQLLADVTSSERDWLIRHAKVVLYPTSAEGFGLVPFEAAVLGTPTVFVSFGPLAEALPDVPVVAADWTPSALADAMERLIQDPDLASKQVAAVLRVSQNLTWERYADKLVETYRQALARPASH